eukprot:GEMP01039936.1.p1 GENE.GEMP01039936.1~~GEMP01039936.1.p1  ORF type:complete len:146 (-),score=29.40 GEMP01039936.1:796-1233(-)
MFVSSLRSEFSLGILLREPDVALNEADLRGAFSNKSSATLSIRSDNCFAVVLRVAFGRAAFGRAAFGRAASRHLSSSSLGILLREPDVNLDADNMPGAFDEKSSITLSVCSDNCFAAVLCAAFGRAALGRAAFGRDSSRHLSTSS